MKRKTKIVCTLGPASEDPQVIRAMSNAGMDVARINFSHGQHPYHLKLIQAVREVNERYKKKIEILQDLEGYRMRIGQLKHPIVLKDGQHIWMSYKPCSRKDCVPLDLDADLKGISEGMDVFIADGMIALKVLGQKGPRIKLEVIQGGKISSKKGINIPKLKLQANILTQKDKEDLEFGLHQGVDFIAMSFVRNRQDMLRVIKMVKPKLPACQFVAKIENDQGLRNLDGIIEVSDGVIVARGDLGVSLPIYKIPILQKDIIRRCNQKRKLVITATQMLESMVHYTRPTRAEVTDVANAILDGTHYVMLSAETAIGDFPVESVRMMCQIIRYTEETIYR